MTSPFDPAPQSIPVTIITHGPVPAEPAARILHLEPALHDHEPGGECIACAARSDIRAILFDLLQTARADQRPLTAVTLDASDLRNAQPIIDRLEPGRIPALGLRDHTVAKSFHLSRVI